jgi:hypothetical protein
MSSTSRFFFERVAEEKQVQWVTYWKTFSHENLINDEIEAGERRALFPDDPTMIPGSDVLRLIVDYYNLDEDIEDYLCLKYKTYGGNGQERIKILSEKETLEGKILRQQDGIERALTLEDIDLYLKLPAGPIVLEDISCDSDYML